MVQQNNVAFQCYILQNCSGDMNKEIFTCFFSKHDNAEIDHYIIAPQVQNKYQYLFEFCYEVYRQIAETFATEYEGQKYK